MGRIEKQRALDIIRFTNIINDLVDCASYYLHDIDPIDGTSPVMDKSNNSPEESTVDYLKSKVNNTYKSILPYYQILTSYIDGSDTQAIVDSLASEGITASELRTEIDTMRNAIVYVTDNLGFATTKIELAALGTFIDSNVPKLDLVRRAWTKV